MQHLQSKVVVLTGASSGIGRATALALAREGATLYLVARRQQRLDEVCEQVRALGGRASAHVFDVRDASAFVELAQTVVAQEGRVDVLINNAGGGVTKTFMETTDDDWAWTFDTNFHSVVSAVRAFLPTMLEQRHGVIVNVASIAGITGSMLTAYTASKFALVGLSESLLLEHGPSGIEVVVVCPGVINTEIADVAISSGRDNSRIGPKMRQFMSRYGADPEVVGRDIVRAIQNPRFLVFTPGHANAMAIVYKWLPGLSRALTRRMGS